LAQSCIYVPVGGRILKSETPLLSSLNCLRLKLNVVQLSFKFVLMHLGLC